MFCKQCGKEIEDGSTFCPFCGAGQADDAQAAQQQAQPAQQAQPQYGQYQPPYTAQPTYTAPPVQESGAGWGVLGFFFPVVGLILFLVWKDDHPARSKGAGIGALVGVIVSVVGTVLLYVLYFVIMMGAAGAYGAVAAPALALL